MEVLMITLNKADDEYYNDDGIPCCKNCKTPRYFIRENFITRCKCKCQMEEIKKREELERQEKIKEYLKNLKEQSLLGERYRNCSFDNMQIVNQEHKNIVERLKTYCTGFKNNNNGLGIYLFGKSGSGKTFLTACMLDKLNSQFIECMFTNISSLKEEILNNKKQKDFIKKITTVPVLFIDDFGTEIYKKNSDDNWVQELTYNIINTRYNNCLPIIYTSNYSLKECLENRGLANKTIDRIFETTVQIKLDLPSFRLKEKKNIYF